MPWWSWVLIWTGLVLVLLGVLAACGWMLFRKTMTAFHALEELTGKLELLDAASVPRETEPFVPSILLPRDEVAARHDAVASERADRKERRRALRLERGRLLTSADLRKRTFPWESSAMRSPDGT
jgi:hypothetical protein